MLLRDKLRLGLAVALIVTFFLPWAKLFFFTGSGFQIGMHLGGEAKLVWLMPLAAIALVFAVLKEYKAQLALKITGTVPWVFLLWVFFKAGPDLFSVLTLGAYLALVVGALMILDGFGVELVPKPIDDDPVAEE